MRKKSAIMASTIAAVLTTSVLAFSLPNQVFAPCGCTRGQGGVGQILGGDEEQVGKVLAGHKSQLGEEAQLPKIIPGKINVVSSTRGPIKP